jgi:hypothetical protein
MACWQVPFTLVSAARLQPGYRRRIAHVLPWDAHGGAHSYERWGCPATDCIELVSLSRPMNLWARFDMRAPDPRVWERFLLFARQERLELHDERGRLVTPVLPEFVLALCASPAFRWVPDPWHFLRTLDRKHSA